MTILRLYHDRYCETAQLTDEVYTRALKIGLNTLLSDEATPYKIKLEIEKALVPKPEGGYRRKGYV